MLFPTVQFAIFFSSCSRPRGRSCRIRGRGSRSSSRRATSSTRPRTGASALLLGGTDARQPGRRPAHPPRPRRPRGAASGSWRRRSSSTSACSASSSTTASSSRTSATCSTRVGLGLPLPLLVPRAADRRQLLHLPGDLVRRRRAPRAAPARLAARLRDLPELLPPPRGGPDRAGARVHPPARHAARPRRRRRRRGGDAHRRSGWSRRSRSPTTWRARSSTRSSPSRRRTPRRTSCSPPTPTPRRSTATSPATRTSRSAWRCCMGFVFPQNFDRPYRAPSFRDFWRRWHMTLSRFLRDFLYIPLGGNRRRRARTYRNLMITMVLGGLWHGAAWTFVLWGAFHGAALVVEHALGGRRLARIPRLAAAGSSCCTSSCSAGSCSARPTSPSSGTFLARLVDPGAATLWTVPVVLAVLVGDRPPARAARRPLERAARLRSSAAIPSRSAWASRSSSCSSARRSPARASRRSSTSSSEMTDTSDPETTPLYETPHGAARRRARRDRLRRCSRRSLLVLLAGRRRCAGRRGDEPRDRRATSCSRSASRRAGSPTGCRSPTR